MILLILFFILFLSLFEKGTSQEKPLQNINYGLDFKLTYNVGKTLKRRSSITSQVKENSECGAPIKLQDIADFASIEYGVFMMETSGIDPLILKI